MFRDIYPLNLFTNPDARNKIWEWTKSGAEFLKDVAVGTARAIPRAWMGLGVDIGNLIFGKEEKEVYPQSLGKVGTFLLGEEPIQSLSERIKSSIKTGEKIGEAIGGKKTEALGGVLGGLAGFGLFALDASPFGFGKQLISDVAANQLAKETSKEVIEGILRKELPKLADNENFLKIASEKLVKINNKDDVLKELQKTINELGTIKKGVKPLAVNTEKEIKSAVEINNLKNKLVGSSDGDILREINMPTEKMVMSSFWKTRFRIGDITPEELKRISEEGGVVFYTPRTHQSFFEHLQKKIDIAGIETIDDMYKVVKNKSGKFLNKAENRYYSFSSEERQMMSYFLWKHFRQNKMWEESVEMAKFMREVATESGRAVEIMKVMPLAEKLRMSTFSLAESIKDFAIKYGKELPEQAMKDLEILSQRLLTAEGDNNFSKILKEGIDDFVKKYIPEMPDVEKLDIMRYGWTLFNPRSWSRNGLNNIIQAVALRPATLFMTASIQKIKKFLGMVDETEELIDFSSIAEYSKNIIRGIKVGFEQFLYTLKHGSPSGKYLDILQEEGVEALIRQSQLNVGGGHFFQSSIFPLKLMEATDQLVSSMIFSGEKARMIKAYQNAGVKITEAIERFIDEKALDIAEKYLYRNKLGESKEKILPFFASALDSFGDFILKMRNGLRRTASSSGRTSDWAKYYAFSTFSLFVRTPANVGKVFLEYSPLSADILFTKGATTEQKAKFVLGSILTSLGAYKAMRGEITFLPPSDPELRQKFFDAGLKPLSIKIGDKWYSLFNFGIPGMAMSLGAVYNWAKQELNVKDDDVSFDEVILKSLTGSLKVISEQTSLTGLSSFLKTLTGDIDYTMPQTLTFQSTQYVPYNGLLKFLNSFLDPIYRKSGKEFSEALKREFSAYFKLWYKSTGKSEEDIERLLPEAYTKINPETGELEKSRKGLGELLSPYPAFLKTEKKLEQELQESIQEKIVKTKAKSFISEDVLKEEKEKSRKLDALVQYIKNPDVPKEEKIEKLKKIKEEDERFFKTIKERIKQEKIKKQIPEYIPPELKNWSIPRRASYVLNLIEKMKKEGREEELVEVLTKLRETNILTKETFEEIKRQKGRKIETKQ